VNGRRLTLTDDGAYDLIVDVPADALDDVGALAARIRHGSAQRVRTR